MSFYFVEKQEFTSRAEEGRDPKVRENLCSLSSPILSQMIHHLNQEHISAHSGSADNLQFKNWLGPNGYL